ncbi:hypothetical protein H257_00709 [Aphanomyces astaci]|uniref:t-SNARE coiled-coil homology domain-containing protein n=1 Tax=Aphanomyces astaci TaxID=112090 RepID=W4HBV5_APHAT|nr:hypothetical protein H257_00709 [Aphanomyces astaci]ETV89422.1 hypothetical protein H257_00709 [Aphanomyces astaci]RHY06915.1 hypothetical protein DYB25_001751 [Aphanomyces astaci]RHY08269.1 hypothetical protein DYB36_001543 [Aphanomyces astaci]RHY54577.1 hypothetical protein DYB38_000170 [Aphanomyces astaci]RHY62166.1 hypothetical protein DYB30_001529 [Aphanomyces astaci]|eukprot:XP_009821822.1 hypothetical protein H257_00709 [Aphanomyces astaci]
MRGQYDSLESPKAGIMSAEKYDKLVGEVSKALGHLNTTVRAVDQKVSLFGTSLDSHSSHEKLRELLGNGNKLISKIEKRLKALGDDIKGQSGPVVRARSNTLKKLSTDFKTQHDLFSQSSQNAKVAHVNLPSAAQPSAINQPRPAPGGFTNYHEDQFLAQAQVTTYDEDDLVRREEDIIHINHQLREINAAYKEVDGLINDQHEVVVEIADNVQEARNETHGALEHVQKADGRSNYCNCSKRKLYCYGGLAFIFVLMVLGVIIAVTK